VSVEGVAATREASRRQQIVGRDRASLPRELLLIHVVVVARGTGGVILGGVVLFLRVLVRRRVALVEGCCCCDGVILFILAVLLLVSGGVRGPLSREHRISARATWWLKLHLELSSDH